MAPPYTIFLQIEDEAHPGDTPRRVAKIWESDDRAEIATKFAEAVALLSSHPHFHTAVTELEGCFCDDCQNDIEPVDPEPH